MLADGTWVAVRHGVNVPAARILGLDTLSEAAELVVLVDGRSTRGERRDGYVVRQAALPAGHRTTRHGVPITTAARAVVDLEREWPLADAVVAADSALRTARTSLSELHAVLADCAGLQRATRVVGLADPKCESPLESISRVAMHTQELPAPRTQAVISDVRGPFARWTSFGRRAHDRRGGRPGEVRNGRAAQRARHRPRGETP